jgi:DNA-binding MarR family transcriptional regulator
MDEIDLMGAIYRFWRRACAERLKEYDISFSQLHLIQLARRRGAISHAAAAVALDCDRPTLTLVARHCTNKGWLVRKSSPEDGRSSLLMLTGTGEELLDRIEASGALTDMSAEDILRALDGNEREILRVLLLKAYDRVARMGAGEAGTRGPIDGA